MRDLLQTPRIKRLSNLPFDVEAPRSNREWLALANDNPKGIPGGWVALVAEVLGVPSHLQWQVIMAWLYDVRQILVLGGERGGKSFVTAFCACLQLCPVDTNGNERYLWKPGMLSAAKKGRIWIVGPDYTQARAEFTYIQEFLEATSPSEEAPNIVQLSVPKAGSQPWSLETSWGALVETKTSSAIEKIASFPADMVLIVEAHQQEPDIRRKAEGRVLERRGSVIMSGTLERSLPWYSTLYEKWQGLNPVGMSFSIPTWANLAMFPDGWDDPEIQKLVGPHGGDDYFWERYGATPRPNHLLAIPEFSERSHVKPLTVDPDLPVELFADPGALTYAVGFAQRIGPMVHVLDAIYMHNTQIRDVIYAVQNHPLFPLVSKESGNVIDIAGEYRQLGGIPQTTTWREEAGIIFTGTRIRRERDVVDVLRFRLSTNNSFRMPLVLFNTALPNPDIDDDYAREALSEFRLWKYSDRGGNAGAPRRPIDNNNHFLKALGYYLIHHYGILEARKGRQAPQSLFPAIPHYKGESHRRIMA